MVAKARHSGHLMRVTAPTGGYSSGDLVLFTGGVGVVEDDVAAGEIGNVHLSGVFRLTKPAAATSGFAVGAPVYVTSTGALNSTATGDQFAGLADAAAATGATSVDVNINAGSAPIF